MLEKSLFLNVSSGRNMEDERQPVNESAAYFAKAEQEHQQSTQFSAAVERKHGTYFKASVMFNL